MRKPMPPTLRSQILLLFTAILLVASTTVAAAGREPMDGHRWLSLSENARDLYLLGLNDGLNEAAAALLGGDDHGYAKYSAFYKHYDPHGMSVDEIRKGIDLIYADPANANVRVVDALQAFLMRVGGTSQSEIQTYLESSRRKALELRNEPN